MSDSPASSAEKTSPVIVTTDHSPDVHVEIAPGDRVAFRQPRLALFAVALFAVALFTVAGPWLLGEQISDSIDAGDGLRWVGPPLFLIPLAAALWLLRSRTEIDGAGIDVVTFASRRHLAWSDVAGIRIGKRGAVFADCTDGTAVRLPAVTLSTLPRASVASEGRIPALD